MGKPSSSTVTSQSGPPQQFLDAYSQLVQQAQGVSQSPLVQYPIQSGGKNLVAQFTPNQQKAFGEVGNLQGVAQPYIDTAQGYMSNAATPISPMSFGSNPTDLTGQGLAGFNTAASQAGNVAATGAGLAGSIRPYTNAAATAGSGLAGAVQPYTDFAGQTGAGLAGSVKPYTNFAQQDATGMAGALQPYTSAAMQGQPNNFAQSLAAYQDPYTSQVVNATQRQFDEQNAEQLAQVKGNAASAGAFGGDREAIAEAETARQQKLAQDPVIANLRQQGFTGAESQLNAEQQAALGAGQLTEGARAAAGQLGLGAGQLTEGAGAAGGQLGLGAGQLTEGAGAAGGQLNLGAGQLTEGAGAAGGQLGLGAGQLGLAGGQGLLGEFNTQQQAGIGAQETTGWLNQGAGYGMANLGQESLNTGLAGANALSNVGAQQQGRQQQLLNLPYEQFIQRQAYPFQTTGWLANIAEGLGGASGGTSGTTYPGPSTGSQILGGGLAGAGLLGSTGAFGSNGWMSGLGGGGGYSMDFGGGGTGAFTGADGGRITNAANGGRMEPRRGLSDPPHFAIGGVPDLSMSIVPGGSGLGDQSPHGIGGGLASNFRQPVTTQTQTGGGGSNIAGDVGAAASLARLGMMFLAASGGRVKDHHYDDGGTVTNGSTPSHTITLTIPDLSKAYIPASTAPGRTMGPPSAPSMSQQPNPISQAVSGLSSMQGISKLFGGSSSGNSGTVSSSSLGGAVEPTPGLQGYAGGGMPGAAGFQATQGASGSPMQSNLISQYSQMPVEQLQEMAMRYPPTTPQGVAIARALQMKKMTAGTNYPGGPSPSGPAGASGDVTPGTTAARGGRMGLASGGVPDFDDTAHDPREYIEPPPRFDDRGQPWSAPSAPKGLANPPLPSHDRQRSPHGFDDGGTPDLSAILPSDETDWGKLGDSLSGLITYRDPSEPQSDQQPAWLKERYDKPPLPEPREQITPETTLPPAGLGSAMPSNVAVAGQHDEGLVAPPPGAGGGASSASGTAPTLVPGGVGKPSSAPPPNFSIAPTGDGLATAPPASDQDFETRRDSAGEYRVPRSWSTDSIGLSGPMPGVVVDDSTSSAPPPSGGLAPGFARDDRGHLTRNGQPPDTMLPGGVPAWNASPAGAMGWDQAWPLIKHFESGDRNVPNYRYDRGHTAGGYGQITDTNWRVYGPAVGIDTKLFPTAMSASPMAQEAVAHTMFDEDRAHGGTGFGPWAPFNSRLASFLGSGKSLPGGDQVVGPGTGKPGVEGAPGATPTSAPQTTGLATPLPAERPEREHSFMSSPWMPLIAVGAGMMASRSPYMGTAIGEGLETGLKVAGAQNTRENQATLAEARATSADALAKARQSNAETAAGHLVDLSNYHQALIDKGAAQTELGQNKAAAAAAAAAANIDIKRQQLEIMNYKVQLGEYNPPQFGHKDQNDPNSPTGTWYLAKNPGDPNSPPRFIEGVGAPKPVAGVAAFENKQQVWLHLHPGDNQGAADFAAGRKNISQAEYGRLVGAEEANQLNVWKAANAMNPSARPPNFHDKAVAQVNATIGGAPGASTAPAPGQPAQRPTSSAVPPQAAAPAAPMGHTATGPNGAKVYSPDGHQWFTDPAYHTPYQAPAQP